MADYIDKEAMRKAISEQERLRGLKGLGWVEAAMDKLPTITTPTIGHCKDCDSWDEDLSAGRKSLGNYVCYCHEWGDPEIGFCRFTSPNDYCSYFEPKEEMEDDSNKDGSLVTNCFPNEPLTLEQLRQMDGQPVWVEDVEHWALIDIEKGGQWDGMPFATWQKKGVRF